MSHCFYKLKIRFIPGIISRINYFITGCDLPPAAIIGKNVRFQHYGCGVIINNNTTIGDNTMIMPHVVIGQNVRMNQKVVPLERIVIGNGVLLGAGAKIIASGFLEIGDNSVIGANAVVLRSVPPNTIMVGIPAHIVSKKENH